MSAPGDGRLDMSGMWEGSYVYPGYAGPTTPFVATLTDRDGHLSGSILEPDLRGWSGGTGELESAVAGMRDVQAVDFIKTYGPGRLNNFRVDYVGKLSDDGIQVTGVWSNGRQDGTFEMRRERGWEEAIAVAEEAPLEAESAMPQSAADPGSMRDG